MLGQLVPLVEAFLASDRLSSMPALFQTNDSRRRRILLTLNMNRIVRHLWGAIRDENTIALTPVFDSERPIRSTGDMLPWFTGRPGLTRSTPTSTAACTTARGKRVKPSRSTAIRAWLPG